MYSLVKSEKSRFFSARVSTRKMSTSMRVEDRLDGADNFKYYKNRIKLILEHNELLDHIKNMLPELEDE
jgi:hypothetical protein